jgi:O-succinylbenzoic acid--CoA ligase
MTETCAQIAANPMLRSGGMYIPKKSVGRVFEPNEIDIRDDNGNSLPYLESGQIWLKGPQVFDGYHQEELNRAAFDSDGWFNTGDFGHINRKKHLFVESRRTDLIISGGENISPVEVEDALKKLGIVNDAAVVGVPDREWGQKAVAFIRTENQQSADPDSLRIQLKGALQTFKIPKEFVVIDEIPKTSTGKIRRKELRDNYLKETRQK